MIISCENCDSKFNLDEKILKQTGSKVRCSKCSHIFVAYPPMAPQEPEEPADIVVGQEVEAPLAEEGEQAAGEAEALPDDLDMELGLAGEEKGEEPAPAAEAADDLDLSDMELDLDAEPAVEEEAAAPAEDLDLDLDLDLAGEAEETEEAAEAPAVEAADDLDLSDLELDLDAEPAVEEEAVEAGEELEVEEIDLSDIESMLEDDSDTEKVSRVVEEEGIEVETEELDLTDLEAELDKAGDAEQAEAEIEDVDLEFDIEEGIEDTETAASGVELETTELDVSELEMEDDLQLEDEAELQDAETVFEMDEPAAELAAQAPDQKGIAADLREPVEAEKKVEEEAYEETEILAKKQRPVRPVRKKKKGAGKPVLVLLLIILLGGGAVVGLPRVGIEIPYVTDFARTIPYVGDFLGSQVEDRGNLKISTFGLNSNFVENAKSGTLFVITGKARNDYDGPRGFVKINGSLYTKGKQLSQTQTVYCGNVLSEKELSQTDVATIKKRLLSPAGKNKSNVRINPGANVPFMIVFSNLPSDLDEFSVEVEESQNLAK